MHPVLGLGVAGIKASRARPAPRETWVGVVADGGPAPRQSDQMQREGTAWRLWACSCFLTLIPSAMALMTSDLRLKTPNGPKAVVWVHSR